MGKTLVISFAARQGKQPNGYIIAQCCPAGWPELLQPSLSLGGAVESRRGLTQLSWAEQNLHIGSHLLPM